MNRIGVDHYLGEYNRLQAAAPDWLNGLRRSAIESFRQRGFPSLRHEDWKYTDVRPITRRNFVTADPAANGFERDYIDAIRFKQMDCHELTFTNGRYLPSLSAVRGPANGVILKSLSDALNENRTSIEPCLKQFSQLDRNGFATLNTAFITHGAFIYIPDNSRLDLPVHLLFLSNNQARSHVSHLRNLIVLGENTRATVVESYIGEDGSEYFTNTVTNIVTGTGSSLEHYKLQQESLQGFHVGKITVQQLRGSRMESHSVSLGGALVRNDIETHLAEAGAEVILNGLYIANGRQHIDNHTCINHAKPHTSSAEYYRGVLDGHARGVFNGKVIVREQAQKTDARQSNANLLLSDNAEVDTKPELEIYADDVKCSHGATIGQLDDNMLFYLRSRAIEEETAKSLLTFAFADDVIKRIKFTPIRERLESIVAGKLPGTGLIRDFIK
ncbi:MAG: Fe-S cluster assembly protein SufD [Gammaproteobacteria bacterium]